RLLDEEAGVAQDREVGAPLVVVVDRVDLRAQILHDLHGVRVRLLGDDETDSWHVVDPELVADLLDTILDAAELSQRDGASLPLRDDRVADLLDGLKLAARADHDLLSRREHVAGRDVAVFSGQGRANVGHADRQRGEALAGELDADLSAPTAA